MKKKTVVATTLSPLLVSTAILTNAVQADEVETHEIIKLMSDIDKWEKAQIERILEVATLNSQVKYILKDNDIKEFYVKISQGTNSIHAKKVRELMEK